MDAAAAFLESSRPTQIVTVNALLLLEAESSPDLRAACAGASLVVNDSSGIAWAARLRRASRPARFPGIDLAQALCAAAERRGCPIYLIGGAPGVASEAADALRRWFPAVRIAGVRDGFFDPEDDDAVVAEIAGRKPRLVLVGLGMPKQDLWIHRHLSRLPPGVAMGVGGTFDVWSGRVPRAPAWMRRAGLEWLYRLLREPWRWRRIARLPVFAWKILIGAA